MTKWTTPTGVAAYMCNLAGHALILPMIPYAEFQKAALSAVQIVRRRDA